jgi:hypothetical protein
VTPNEAVLSTFRSVHPFCLFNLTNRYEIVSCLVAGASKVRRARSEFFQVSWLADGCVFRVLTFSRLPLSLCGSHASV